MCWHPGTGLCPALLPEPRAAEPVPARALAFLCFRLDQPRTRLRHARQAPAAHAPHQPASPWPRRVESAHTPPAGHTGTHTHLDLTLAHVVAVPPPRQALPLPLAAVLCPAMPFCLALALLWSRLAGADPYRCLGLTVDLRPVLLPPSFRCHAVGDHNQATAVPAFSRACAARNPTLCRLRFPYPIADGHR